MLATVRFSRTILLVVALACSCSCAQWHRVRAASTARRVNEQSARDAALDWLELLDDKEYEEALDRESARLRAAVSVSQFERGMRARREPFGRLLSRKFIGAAPSRKMSGAPDADYESVLFRSAFTHKASAAERVILVRESGRWRVVDYRLY